MRNPIERYWSAMRMNERENPTESAAVRAVKELKNEQHLLRGRYDLTIRALENAFGEGGYQLLFYETLFHTSTIQQVCNFLDISFRPADFEARYNASPSDTHLPASVRREIAQTFSVVFEMVDKHVGGLPEEWYESIDC